MDKAALFCFKFAKMGKFIVPMIGVLKMYTLTTLCMSFTVKPNMFPANKSGICHITYS